MSVVQIIVGCLMGLASTAVFALAPAEESAKHAGSTGNGTSERRAGKDLTRACGEEGFTGRYGTFTPQEAAATKAANDYNNSLATVVFSKKTVPSQSFYPLLTVEEITHSQTASYPNYGMANNVSYDVLDGWRAALADDTVIRQAMADGLLCELAGYSGFANSIDSIFSQQKAYETMVEVGGKVKTISAGKDKLQRAKVAKETFASLREELRSGNVPTQSFLRAAFKQIFANEQKLLAMKRNLEKRNRHQPEEKVEPLTLEPDLREQIKKLVALKKKGDGVTEEEKALLQYVDKFMQEPRFSYLMHPQLAALMRQAFAEGLVESTDRAISTTQLRDLERTLQREISPALSLSSSIDPWRGRGRISSEAEGAPFSIGANDQTVSDLVNRRIEELSRDYAGQPLLDRLNRMHSELMGTLNNYDVLKHSPSPAHEAVRDAIVRAANQVEIASDPLKELLARQQEAGLSEEERSTAAANRRKNTSTNKLKGASLANPTALEKDAETLRELAQAAAQTFTPKSLENYGKYPAILKKVVEALRFGPSAFAAGSKQDKDAVKSFLRTGHTADLLQAIHTSQSFWDSTVNALREAGAEASAVALLREFSGKGQRTAEQQTRYETVRAHLVAKISEANKAGGELSDAAAANVIALNLLDEHGLKESTKRVSAERESSEQRASSTFYYTPKHLAAQLMREREVLEGVAAETGETVAVIEAKVRAHATENLGKDTGLDSKARMVVLSRLYGDLVTATDPSGVPKDVQLGVLDIAKGAVTARSKDAVGNLERLVLNPITNDQLAVFTQAHTGTASADLFRGGVPAALGDSLVDLVGAVPPLQVENPQALIDLAKQYDLHQAKKQESVRQVALGILEAARSAAEADRLARQEENYSPAVNLALFGLLYPLQRQESLQNLTEPLAHFFAQPDGNVAATEALKAKLVEYDALVGEGGAFGAEKIELILKGLVELRRLSGGNSLPETVRANRKIIQAENNQWEKSLQTAFPNASSDQLVASEQLISQMAKYQNALEGIAGASARYPESHVPEEWRNRVANEFLSQMGNAFTKGEGVTDSAERTAKREDLFAVVEAAERKLYDEAREVAKGESKAFQAKVKELTDPKGKYSAAKLSYDPIYHTLVIHKDSYIDQEVLDRLRDLGKMNLSIEGVASYDLGTGQSSLEAWLASKRYEFGLHGSNEVSPGRFNEAAEPWLPLNDVTAYKILVSADGKMEYRFRPIKEVQAELTRNLAQTKAARARYIDAQKDYGSAGHAAKAYFGSVMQNAVTLGTYANPVTATGALLSGKGAPQVFDANDTREAISLTKSWNEYAKHTDSVRSIGHITDPETGKTAAELTTAQREVMRELLQKEDAAIGAFITKVGVMHELTFMLATVPISGGVASAMTRLAWIAHGSSKAAWAARSILTIAKAARAYRNATLSAAATAAIFTGIEAGLTAGGKALQANRDRLPDWWILQNIKENLGRAPKMIESKLELAAKSPSAWRKYTSRPREADFFKDRLHPTTQEALAYREALFEFEIEEQLDPNYDGIPVNHDWSAADFAWEQTENFAGQWKFFQGLNLSKAAPLLARGGLPGEMAFAGVWKQLNRGEFNFEALRDEEARRHRLAVATGGSDPLGGERGIVALLGNEVREGAIEGARFWAATKVPGAVQKWMGAPGANRLVNFGRNATSTGSFIGADIALKKGLQAARQGYVENPFDTSAGIEGLAHDLTMGGYIGWGLAKGGQQKVRFDTLKRDYLKIGKAGESQSTASAAGAHEPFLPRLLAQEFAGREADALAFLRSVSARELSTAPKPVQEEFLQFMAKQAEQAAADMQQFARSEGNLNLSEPQLAPRGNAVSEAVRRAKEVTGSAATGVVDKVALRNRHADLNQFRTAANEMAAGVPRFLELSRLSVQRELTPAEAAELRRFNTSREALQLQLGDTVSRLDAEHTRAQGRVARLRQLAQNRELSSAERKQFERDEQIVKEYQNGAGLLSQAFVRLDSIKVYQQPLEYMMATANPMTAMAKGLLETTHPNALAALQQERERREASRLSRGLGVINRVQADHGAVDLRPGGSMWHGPTGFESAMSEATSLIDSARMASKDPKAQQELLDLRRLIDPKGTLSQEEVELRQERERLMRRR